VLYIQQQATSGGHSVVRPQGELDALNLTSFRFALADLAGCEALVIDLSDVAFIDSAGLGAIVGGVRRARHSGTRVAVACARPGLAQILHTVGIESIVTVFDTLDEAAAALKSNC
jgi:anti-sigma B factor antagonist